MLCTLSPTEVGVVASVSRGFAEEERARVGQSRYVLYFVEIASGRTENEAGDTDGWCRLFRRDRGAYNFDGHQRSVRFRRLKESRHLPALLHSVYPTFILFHSLFIFTRLSVCYSFSLLPLHVLIYCFSLALVQRTYVVYSVFKHNIILFFIFLFFVKTKVINLHVVLIRCMSVITSDDEWVIEDEGS